MRRSAASSRMAANEEVRNKFEDGGELQGLQQVPGWWRMRSSQQLPGSLGLCLVPVPLIFFFRELTRVFFDHSIFRNQTETEAPDRNLQTSKFWYFTYF